MDIKDWSTTAGSNTDIEGVNIAEGCEPANINNAIRLAMANVAALRDLIGGAVATGGAANAYTLTSGLGLAAYAQSLLLGFEANHTNSGAATLAVDGLAAKSLKRADGSALLAGDLTAGGIYLAAYEAGADVIQVLTIAGLTAAGAAALTNKTIDGDLNTLQDIATGALKTRTGTDAAVVTGTAGANGNLAAWDANGDMIDAAVAAASVARIDAEDQMLTGGARVTEKSLGSISAGTVTPDPGDRPMQSYTNDGAHTLAPGSNVGAYILTITNGASAGAIATSGWTKVSGGGFTTTNAHKFRCHCSIGAAGSLLIVQAMQ